MTRRRLILMAYLSAFVVTVAGIMLGWRDGWALTVLASVFFLNFVFQGVRHSVTPLFGPRAQSHQNSSDREDRSE
jgi:low affinity Fe/Cu permease